MNRLITIIIVSCCLYFVASGHQPDDDVSCPHHKPQPVFNNFGQCIDYFLKYSYPFHNLTDECVAAACPKVTSVCPYDCDGNLDPEALETMGHILTSCIQTREVICGVNIGRMSLVPLTFTTATLIDPSMANGTCAMNPGTGYIQNLNSTVFTFPKHKNTGSRLISLDMNIPLFSYRGGFTCDFNFTFLQGFMASDELTRVTFTDMQGQANYSFNPSATIDLRSTIEVQSPESTLSIAAENFISPDVSLPQCMVNMFNEGLNGFFVKSPADTTAARFLSTLAASALRAANQSCSEN